MIYRCNEFHPHETMCQCFQDTLCLACSLGKLYIVWSYFNYKSNDIFLLSHSWRHKYEMHWEWPFLFYSILLWTYGILCNFDCLLNLFRHWRGKEKWVVRHGSRTTAGSTPSYKCWQPSQAKVPCSAWAINIKRCYGELLDIFMLFDIACDDEKRRTLERLCELLCIIWPLNDM